MRPGEQVDDSGYPMMKAYIFLPHSWTFHHESGVVTTNSEHALSGDEGVDTWLRPSHRDHRRGVEPPHWRGLHHDRST